MKLNFPADVASIQERISQIDPVKYGKTRNYTDGAVTGLSPYISRGVISTHQVLKKVLERGYTLREIESFVKELCWRDYFQRVAQVKDLHLEIRFPQMTVHNHGIPSQIVTASTGIEGIDNAVKLLYSSGYMHNHCRMYTASLVCNIAQSHWLHPAQWMYYHLLDGDWASNACSWQWVAGANSSKKYFANQENINKFTHTSQKNTYLDKEYEAIEKMEIPAGLLHTEIYPFTTALPESTVNQWEENQPAFIYNYYNLDPDWHQGESGNRILLIEPEFFHKYPVGKQCMDFMLALSKNISGIQIFTGSFNEFTDKFNPSEVYYKEHPLNSGYKGIQEERDWISREVTGYYPSFFAYRKKIEKNIIRLFPEK